MPIILDQICWDFKASVFNFVWLSYSLCCLADELDFSTELKLSFFQLGISPQILASILMQVLSFFFGQITHFLIRLFCITTLYGPCLLFFSKQFVDFHIRSSIQRLKNASLFTKILDCWNPLFILFFFSRLHAAVSVNESSLSVGA